MKFLCDQMLSRLGRWLRAAGYDTATIDNQLEDNLILELALKENRKLLTRDKPFSQTKDAQNTIVYLHSNSLQGCIQELNQKFRINWLYRPLSRCLVCNTPFETPSEDFVADNVPPDVRKHSKRFWYCSKCQKIYWEGSHTKRILSQLQEWQQY